MSRVVAVTGATGFIGGHVVRALCQAGTRVRILARRLPEHPFTQDLPLDVVVGDLDDAESLQCLVEDTHAVVHLAGVIRARRQRDFFRHNAEALNRFAQVLKFQSSACRLIYVSSLAAREPGLSAYAASKRAGETFLLQHPDLDWSVVRPPAVYGPGDRETLTIFKLAAHGVAPVVAPAGARLSLIDVRDLARAVAALALHDGDTSRAVYEIDDGHSGGYSWSEIVHVAAKAVGRKVRYLPIPLAAAWTLGAAGDLASIGLAAKPFLTRDKLREIRHADWVVKGRRLQDDLDWRPDISLEQGFADAVAWYRASRWL